MRILPILFVSVLALGPGCGPADQALIPPSPPPVSSPLEPLPAPEAPAVPVTQEPSPQEPQTIALLLDRIERNDLDAGQRETTIRIAMLHSQDPAIRERACAGMAGLGPDRLRLVPYLTLALFADSTISVRLDAAQALADLVPQDLDLILTKAARTATMASPDKQLEVRCMCAGLLAGLKGSLPDDLFEILRQGVLKPEINFMQANRAAVAGLVALDDREGREALLLAALERAESSIISEPIARALGLLLAIDLPEHPTKAAIESLRDQARRRIDTASP